jgi:hypothetical protein
MRLLFRELREHEKGIVQRLGRPKQHLRILEIGPGQGRERARYFGIRNEVVAMNFDVTRWRLSQWRALFSAITPGYEEHLEAHDNWERYGPRMTAALRHELRQYTDEELFTVDAIYLWKKPLNDGEKSAARVDRRPERWSVKPHDIRSDQNK